MTVFEGDIAQVKCVAVADVAHAIADQLNFATGILPGDGDSPNALWWANTPEGPLTALYEPPRVRRIALAQEVPAPRRFNIPLPGFIFLCRPSKPPAVYAVKERPAGPGTEIFHAPLCNVHPAGNSCGGSHHYPADVGRIPADFFLCYFADDAVTRHDVSKKFQGDIVKLWESLEGKKRYPLDDLVRFGTVKDLTGSVASENVPDDDDDFDDEDEEEFPDDE